MKRAIAGLALLIAVSVVASAAPPTAAASRSLLDSSDLHVSYIAGAVPRNGKPHNTIQLRKGAFSDNESVDGLVTAISGEEHSVGPNNAVFIQAVSLDADGTHGSVIVVLEETDQLTNLGQWEAPAGGKLTVADAPKDGTLASFAVTPPEPFSTTGPAVPALHVDYDKDNNWYAPDDYAHNNNFYSVDGFLSFNQDSIEWMEEPIRARHARLASTGHPVPDHRPDRSDRNKRRRHRAVVQDTAQGVHEGGVGQWRIHHDQGTVHRDRLGFTPVRAGRHRLCGRTHPACACVSSWRGCGQHRHGQCK